MKLIVAGGRDYLDRKRMLNKVRSLMQKGAIPADVELVCGLARGADLTARGIWKDTLKLPVHDFPAEWDKHGKSAGYKRNLQMGEFADAALVFWNGKSKGTKHMIDIMRRLKKPLCIVMYNQ